MRLEIPLRSCADIRTLHFQEVLLLFDNIEVDGGWPLGHNDYLHPLDIAAGMFGSLTMRFWLDPEQRPIDATDSTHGGGRQVTEEERLYISAIAVLNEATEEIFRYAYPLYDSGAP